MPETNFFEWKQKTYVSSLSLSVNEKDSLVRLALTYTHPYPESDNVRLVLSDPNPTFDTTLKEKLRGEFRDKVVVCEVMIAFEKHLEKLKRAQSQVCPLQKENIGNSEIFALTSHVPYSEINRFAKILMRNGCKEIFWAHIAKQDPESKCCGICFNVKPYLVN